MTDVAIIGLGSIGLSLAQATRNAFAGAEIVGFDPNKAGAKKAKESGVFDAVADRLATALAGASLVVLDAPLNEMEAALQSIGNLAPPSCVVTDTCSLKRPVLDWAAQSLPPSMGFVGGHVILQPANRDGTALTAGATYCVVCDADTPPEAIDVVVSLALAAGARPLFIDADEHDSFVLATDYLPQIARGAVIDAAVRSPVWPDMQNLRDNPFGTDVPGSLAASLEGPSLSDVTMLGAQNASPLLFWIDRLQSELRSTRNAVEKAIATGEMVDFDKLEKDRIELLVHPPQSGVKIQRPGLQTLLLGDWLSDRSKKRRGK